MPRRRGRPREHGQCFTLTYTSWSAMIQRCRNTNHRGFKHYGGRGIRIAERWMTFTNFHADMGDRPSRKHSIHRIDNDGHYEPGNCRWATAKEQASNRRHNPNMTRVLAHNGISLGLCAWAKRLDMDASTLHRRLARGWPVERALTEPLHNGKHPPGRPSDTPEKSYVEGDFVIQAGVDAPYDRLPIVAKAETVVVVKVNGYKYWTGGPRQVYSPAKFIVFLKPWDNLTRLIEFDARAPSPDAEE